MHSVDAALAGHAYKHMWNCGVCVGMVFLFTVCMLSKPHHLGVNWPTTLCENNDGAHFFTLNFNAIIGNKLLSNCENSDIAWCYKNNSERFFPFSSEKEQNVVSF